MVTKHSKSHPPRWLVPRHRPFRSSREGESRWHWAKAIGAPSSLDFFGDEHAILHRPGVVCVENRVEVIEEK